MVDEVEAAGGQAGARTRALALLRVSHPFPSVLNGAVTGVLASVAGAGPTRALALTVAMIALQGSIGALNDLCDVDRDRVAGRAKPIPAGLVGRQAAWLIVGAGLSIGLSLSAAAGPATLGVALAGTALGYLYDLRLKTTPWAWLPFALGIPLLPVYAWIGAVDRLPVGFAVLVPLAILAGAAIALINGLVDVERDKVAGSVTPAVWLGRSGGWLVAAILEALVSIGAEGSLLAASAPFGAVAGVAAGSLVLGLGLTFSRASQPARRERGWQMGAIGFGVLAAAWAIGYAGRGLL